jgi:hypothetical protein
MPASTRDPSHTMTLRHLVLLRFRSTAPAGEIDAAIAQFVGLAKRIPGIRALEHGLDSSPEGLSRGFTHAFLLSFESAAARDAYLPHPAHQALVERIGPLVEDVLVIDYEPL